MDYTRSVKSVKTRHQGSLIGTNLKKKVIKFAEDVI